jgi:hypothetical protein
VRVTAQDNGEISLPQSALLADYQEANRRYAHALFALALSIGVLSPWSTDDFLALSNVLNDIENPTDRHAA